MPDVLETALINELSQIMLAAQHAALEELLPSDPERAVKTRRRITRSLSARVQELVASLAPPVIAEIGAHEASFSKAMKSRCPQARVLAVEANPKVHSEFVAGLEAAGVEYWNGCVASANGTRTFTVPVRADGSHRLTMGSLLSDRQAVGEHTYEVQSARLDDLIGDVENALWIDVEGGVAEVLEGGQLTLARSHVVYIEVETRQRWNGQWTDRQVIDHLRKFDLHPVSRDIQQSWQYNLLFLSEATLRNERVLSAGRMR